MTETLIEGGELIEEEYNIWKKNCPFLYDVVLSHALDWPSLTVDWLPTKPQQVDENDFFLHKIIVGTMVQVDETNKTPEKGNDTTDDNYLMILNVKIPNYNRKDGIDADKFIETREADIDPSTASNKKFVSVHAKIRHPGEINRARHCPHNPFVIATATKTGTILLYDYSRHPTVPKGNSMGETLASLECHTKDTWGIAWNTTIPGLFASGSYDGSVAVWDTNVMSSRSKVINPTKSYNEHVACVEDVSWHRVEPHTFASVGDDNQLIIWDTRINSSAMKFAPQKEGGEVNCVQFSPHCDTLIFTAGSDSTCGVWDTRIPTERLHSLAGGHDDIEITNMAVNPYSDHLLMTSGKNRVTIWDLSRIGDEIEMNDNIAPEIIFKHAGHRGTVNDLSWNINIPRMIASASHDDNTFQVWQPEEGIWVYEESESESDLDDQSGDDDRDELDECVDGTEIGEGSDDEDNIHKEEDTKT